MLSVPLSSEPGKKWVYADINAVLVGAIIEEKSGMSIRDYAKQKIFDPLEIKEFYWYANAANQTGAASNFDVFSRANPLNPVFRGVVNRF